MIRVTEANFQESVLKAERPFIFVMGAPWCGDCRRMEPFFRKMVETYSDRIGFGNADFDEDPGLREQLDIRHIPTFIIYKEGKEIDRLVEPRDITTLRNFVEKALA